METISAPGVKKGMSIFSVPLGVANIMYAGGWIASVVGAFVTLVGVASLFVAAAARDKDADRRISEAQAVAGGAAEKVALAQKDAAVAQRDAAVATEGAAVANKEAAKANEAAEALRQENLKLEDRLRPRALSATEMAKLTQEMRELNDGRPATVVWVGGAEAESYAREIGKALTAAGFKTTVGTNFIIMSAHGVLIARRTGTVDKFATSAIAAFKRAGVHAEPGELDDLDPKNSVLYIVVGYKPGAPSP